MDDWQKKFYMNKNKFDPFDGQMGIRKPQQQQQIIQQNNYSNNNSSVSCYIHKGTQLYRAIDGQFGTTQVMVVPFGLANDSIASTEFTYTKSITECILVENQQSVIDLSKQQSKIKLIRINSVFNGSFFVNENAIKNAGNILATSKQGTLLKG